MPRNERIVISRKQLQDEVAEYGRSVQQDQAFAKPIHRIHDIVMLLRDFKMAASEANAPPGFAAEFAADARQKAQLKRHRLTALNEPDPARGLRPLRDRLMALNSRFILEGEPWWRINDATWQNEVWNPLQRWVMQGYDMLFDMDGPGWPRPVDDKTFQDWEGQEQRIEDRLLIRMSDFFPPKDLPAVVKAKWEVRWHGERCNLGDTQYFRIMKLFVDLINTDISEEAIRNVMEDPKARPHAVRKAVSRLRQMLRGGGLADLADHIVHSKGVKRHHRLDLD